MNICMKEVYDFLLLFFVQEMYDFLSKKTGYDFLSLFAEDLIGPFTMDQQQLFLWLNMDQQLLYFMSKIILH